MLAQAADRIHSFAPFLEGRPVILACSGGADSTFLARAWRLARENQRFEDSAPSEVQRELPEAVVVVVDHRQHPSSQTQAIQAHSLYSDLGFTTEIRVADALPGVNESSLRSSRYAVLLEAASDHNASHILFAHHADDHAETVLLRILRGTGLAGLAGIPERRNLSSDVELLRPLLGLRAADIRRTLTELGQSWLEDPTNADSAYAARNHLRQEVLPRLAPLASSETTLALQRLSREAADWRDARDEILQSYTNFLDLPSYFRRCAIQQHLQALRETVSPTRLKNLEDALLQRNRAGIDATRFFVIERGRLQVERRK